LLDPTPVIHASAERAAAAGLSANTPAATPRPLGLITSTTAFDPVSPDGG
jgi:hypothetical protein